VKDTLLVHQRKREHRRGARIIISRACDGERTNRDSESSDDGEYDLGHRICLFSVVNPCITATRSFAVMAITKSRFLVATITKSA
jgi:hypothetical protein